MRLYQDIHQYDYFRLHIQFYHLDKVIALLKYQKEWIYLLRLDLKDLEFHYLLGLWIKILECEFYHEISVS